MNKLKRYVIFLIGLFVNSLGVSLITKASLGTSPISSIPYGEYPKVCVNLQTDVR